MTLQARPVILPFEGTLPNQVVGLPVEATDVLEIGDITITPSTGITVSNAAMNIASVEINNRTYAAGQAVEFDLSTTLTAAGTGTVTFAFTATSGKTGPAILQVEIVDGLSVDYISDPIMRATGATNLSELSDAIDKIDYLTVTASTDLDNIRVKSGRFIDAETDLGIVRHDTAITLSLPNISERQANTAALEAYFVANATTPLPPLVFGEGDYFFSGPLDTSTSPGGYRSFTMRGNLGVNNAVQSMEIGGLCDNYKKCRLILCDMAEDDIWMDVESSSTDYFGVIRVEDLIFYIPTAHDGSVFEFGADPVLEDPPAITTKTSTGRGIHVSGCYFSHYDLRANAHAGTPNADAWIRDQGDDGWCLNLSPTKAIHLTNSYNANIVECVFRGWGTAVRINQCDHITVRDIHCINCEKGVIQAGDAVYASDEWKAGDGVPGIYSGVYVEACFVSPVVGIGGMWSGTRVEIGYSDNVQPYELPTGATWSVAAAATYVQLASLPGTRTAADYFTPFTLIYLTPDEDYQPPRWLFVVEVDAANDRIHFANADSICYHNAAISGTAESLERHFGCPSIFGGARTAVSNCSMGNNKEDVYDIPKMAFVPTELNIDVFGCSAHGMGGDPGNPSAHAPIVVGHTGGNTYDASAGITWHGSGYAPVHPLAKVTGTPFHATIRAPDYSYGDFDAVYRPGAGMSTSNNIARCYQFHPLTEEDGRTVYAWHMADHNASMPLPSMRTDETCSYTIRAYADAAMVANAAAQVAIWDGVAATTFSLYGLAVGWHTFQGRTAEAATGFSVTHSKECYISWIGIKYDPIVLVTEQTDLDALRTRVYDVRDYGTVDPLGITDSYAAIQAAFTAAYTNRGTVTAGTYGSSINHTLMNSVYLPRGRYVISQPIVIPDGTFNFIADGAAIVPDATFNADYPLSWAFEVGNEGHNVGILHANVKGLHLAGFRRGVRINYPPSNGNIGRLVFDSCKFGGLDNYPSIGVRIFNRSADVAFRNCTWDNCYINVEQQSVDQVTYVGCRCQAKNWHEWAPSTAYATGSVVFATDSYATGTIGISSGVVTLTSGGAGFPSWAADGMIVVSGYSFPVATLDGPTQVTLEDTSVTLSAGRAYVIYHDDWSAYECPSGRTSGSGTFDSTEKAEWTFLWKVPKTAGLFTVNRGIQRHTGGVLNPPQSTYSRFSTNHYGWFCHKDFESWAADSLYIAGDVVQKAYDTGGNEDVYWSRRNGQEGYSGSAWDATEREKWLVINAPAWGTGIVYAANEVVCEYQASILPSVDRFYVCATPHTAGTFNTDLTAGKWVAITSTDQQILPMSVWSTLNVDRSLCGGEGGGITPVIWDIPGRVDMQGLQSGITRFMSTELMVRDSKLTTNVAISNNLKRPAVLCVAAFPDLCSIVDNSLNDVKAVAVDEAIGQTPLTNRVVGSSDAYKYPYRVRILGNVGGTGGIGADLGAATEYRDWGPNWHPEAMSWFTHEAITTGYKQIMASSGKNIILANSVSFNLNGMYGLGAEPVTLYFGNSNQIMTHTTGHLHLSGAANVTPTAGQMMRFELVNGTPTEIWRNF